MVAHDPWGPSLLPHDSLILIMQLLCHVPRCLIQSFTPHVCILASRKEKEKGKDMPSFFKATPGISIYHFHFHPMVDSVTSNISEETGQRGLHSGQ